MHTELLIGYALSPDFSLQIDMFVVKSSKSDDLARTLFLLAFILQAIMPCKNCGLAIVLHSQTAFSSFIFGQKEKGLVNALYNFCSQNPHFLGILCVASDWC